MIAETIAHHVNNIDGKFLTGIDLTLDNQPKEVNSSILPNDKAATTPIFNFSEIVEERIRKKILLKLKNNITYIVDGKDHQVFRIT